MRKFDWKSTASLDIDCQRGFSPLCPNELPVPDGHTIVDALNAQAQLAMYRVGSMDCHPSNAVWIASKEHPQLSPVKGFINADLYWNAHCIVGTEGIELLPGLPEVAEYDFMVFKGIRPDMHPYGACYHDLFETLSTGLIDYLRMREVKTVIVGGLALDVCVKATAIQLAKRFDVVVNLAACRPIGDPKAAIEEMIQKGIEAISYA